MNFEYLLVGIAKGSVEDFNTLYDNVSLRVYAVALSVVKDKVMARDIAIETLRRVRTYAYSFDTDMNAEFWILEMARTIAVNTMKDPSLVASLASPYVDNAGALLYDALYKLKNERASLLLLRSTSTLSFRDIASLTGFYKASARSEIRRGIAELRKLGHASGNSKGVIAEIARNTADSCPDYRELIDADRQTPVAHISHEALSVDAESYSFDADDPEAEKRAIAEKQLAHKKRTTRNIAMAALILVVAVGAIVSIFHIVSNDNPDVTQPSPTPQVQFGTTIEIVEVNGATFYRSDDGIYRVQMNEDGALPQLIYSSSARDLVSDGERLFFRDVRTGKIFTMNFDGSNLTQMTQRSGTTLECHDGFLYFSASDGIYRMPCTGLSEGSEPECVYLEEVEDAPMRYHMELDDSGRLFFSGGADSGIYYISDSNGIVGLSPIYFDEAYFFQIYENRLYFDALMGRNIYIYGIDLENFKSYTVGMHYDNVENSAEATAVGEPVLSYSAAYYVSDGYIYYEGYKLDENGGRTDIGLYRLLLNSDSPELLFSIGADELHISDMYVSDSYIYCYYSDGMSGGSRSLIAYDKDNLDNRRVIF